MFRRFEKYGFDMTKAYVDALEARGIAHLLVGGKSFHEREEVETLRTALSAIEWPDDELSVFATLHGSLFAIPDEFLLEYRHQFNKLHPFRIGTDLPETLQTIGRALGLLQSLSRSRNYRPVAETISLLLTATRAHAGFAMRPSGEQVLANVMHVTELAREYEANGGTSFRGFVDQMFSDAKRGKHAEAAIYEEGADGVRLMSVHKAKGLEFPVVILADITAKIAHEEPDRYLAPDEGLCAIKLGGWVPNELLEHASEEHARDVSEGVRVAYVAATRARDLLVVPAIGDDPTPGSGPQIGSEWWVSPLYAAMYPPAERRRKPSGAKGCPKFGIDSVLVRPDGDPADDTNVRPGAHAFGSGNEAYSVVWWDPRILDLGKTPSFSIRQEHLLKEGDPTIVETDLRNYNTWRAEHEKIVQNGSLPQVQVQTVTRRAQTSKIEAEVTVVGMAADNRVFGPRFGSLVHAVLATVPLDGTIEQMMDAATLHGRVFGATVEEIETAASAVMTALQHQLMERARTAFAAGLCRREIPITLREQDGIIIEGVVDLAFREADKWVVVDFKTDKELDAAVDVYRRQIAIYADAVSNATGVPAEAFLFRV
jgi:ATP-dependent exoDNAse (exonuclease V) beta subunit